MSPQENTLKPRLVYGREGPEHHAHHCNENGAYRTAANPSRAGWYTVDGRPFPVDLLDTRFVCRECGGRGIDHRVEAREMGDHVSSHGLTVQQYASRWPEHQDAQDVPTYHEDYD